MKEMTFTYKNHLNLNYRLFILKEGFIQYLLSKDDDSIVKQSLIMSKEPSSKEMALTFHKQISKLVQFYNTINSNTQIELNS